MAMQRRRRNPRQLELLYLIVHQADQRRDHQTVSVLLYGWKLIAQRFSAASRHHAEHIAFAADSIDQLFLARAKGIVAEDGLQEIGLHGSLHYKHPADLKL